MTLDCPFRNPLQSRVISVRSCYLTSYGYLHFYQIRFTACSIQQLEFSLTTGSFAVITTFHPQMWGPLGWVDSVFAVWYLPLGASCLPVRRSVTLGYPEEFSWTANLLKLILNPSWSMAYWSLICCSWSFGSWSFSSQRLPDVDPDCLILKFWSLIVLTRSSYGVLLVPLLTVFLVVYFHQFFRFDLAFRVQALGLLLVHWTHPFWL